VGAVYLSDSDINSIIKNYVNSLDGQSSLEKNGLTLSGYSELEMTALAEELLNDIINAYFGILKETKKYFNVDAVKIGNARKLKNGWKLIISFPDKILSRKSLNRVDGKGFINEAGVYDIFGLFTQGYTARKPVYGYWWDNEANDGERETGLVKSLTHRAANPFIINAVNEFRNRHPGIEVTLPSGWVL